MGDTVKTLCEYGYELYYHYHYRSHGPEERIQSLQSPQGKKKTAMCKLAKVGKLSSESERERETDALHACQLHDDGLIPLRLHARKTVTKHNEQRAKSEERTFPLIRVRLPTSSSSGSQSEEIRRSPAELEPEPEPEPGAGAGADVDADAARSGSGRRWRGIRLWFW